MLVLLILIIYYLVSLTSALREANQDLRNQLRRERMEERRKMLKLTEQKQNPQENNAPISLRWRKVLDSASSPLTPTNAGGVIDAEEAQKIQDKKGSYKGRSLIGYRVKKVEEEPSGESELMNIRSDAAKARGHF